MGGSLWISHGATEASFGGRSFLAVLPLALLLPTLRVSGQFMGKPLDCQKTCVCASNIVSCSRVNLTNVPTTLPQYTAVLDLSFNAITRLRAEWTPVPLDRLHSLHLSHNGLTFLSSEAFANVKQLRCLDLSSNYIRQLDEFIFEPLEHLEVLLLYSNRISQIDRTAFSGLASLQRLYLSHNQISRFPLELVKERSRLDSLRLLDVSSNRIKALPLNELQALPAWIKNGLYFHNNPLPCSCEVHEVVARWYIKELSSAVDFRGSHTCVLPGHQKEKIAILDLDKVYLNCSEVTAMDKKAFLEQFLVLDCDTRERNVTKSWALPGNMPVPPAHKIADDGSLRIGPLKAEDSGVYTCYATSESLNETVYVTVVVFNSTEVGGLENLKTAYTTLIGCLVSLVLVLFYLYLTPCHYACCPGQRLEKGDPRDSLHSSTVSITHAHLQTGQERPEGGGGGFFDNKHGAFLQPKDRLEQNGRLNPIGEEDEEWRGDSRGRRRSDAGSVSSVSSDTPMVV